MLPITCHWQSRVREIRWWGNFKRSSCRCDTLVFSGSQTCVILLFRTRAESSFVEKKVKDSDRLELDWLLKCKLEELIASVRPMSAKNCEQIVRARSHWRTKFRAVIDADCRNDGSEGRAWSATNSDEYYFAIRDLFPHVPPENDVLGRLLFRYANVRVAD